MEPNPGQDMSERLGKMLAWVNILKFYANYLLLLQFSSSFEVIQNSTPTNKPEIPILSIPFPAVR